jgi:carboxymethylenebutenolidase
MTEASRSRITYQGDVGPVQTYLARPDTAEPRPAIIVIHEIVGLTEHIKQVADRFADAGYVAFAPNLFSRPGLAEVMTPDNVAEAMRLMMRVPREKWADQASIQQAAAQLSPEKREMLHRVYATMFGGLPRESFIQDLMRAIEYLKAQEYVQPD